jgi:ATP-dependent Lon protease
VAETEQTAPQNPPLPNELPVVPLRGAVVLPMTGGPLGVSRARLSGRERDTWRSGGDRMVLLLWQKNDNDDPAAKTICTGRHRSVDHPARWHGPGRMRGSVRRVVAAARPSSPDSSALHDRADQGTPRPSERRSRSTRTCGGLQELVDKALSLATGSRPTSAPWSLARRSAAHRVSAGQPARHEAGGQAAAARREQRPIKLDAGRDGAAREIDVLELKGQIESRAEKEMTDAQRQYVLRQQLKAIQSELGEGDGEAQELRKRIAEAKLPEHVARVANREVDRLERMTPAAPEYQMIRTYLDWLPRGAVAKRTEDRLDPVEARRVLDEDHYDLDKVKERIVDYLAVRKLKGDMKGPSSASSGRRRRQDVARPVDRAVDEPASSCGSRSAASATRPEDPRHRRTYIGSMPGGSAQALRSAGSSTPVLMLDEIDKRRSHQGNPARRC